MSTFQVSACTMSPNILLDEACQGPSPNSRVRKSLYPVLRTKQVIWARQHQWGREAGGGGLEGVNT